MGKQFQKVLLVGRAGVRDVPETLTALKEVLIAHSVDVCVEQYTADMMESKGAERIPNHKIPKDLDLIIVVGGDGSLLNAAHTALQHDLPITGVHRGHLGFLTDINPDSTEEILQIIQGDYQEDQRSVLSTQAHHNGKLLSEGFALNDVVLLLGNAAQMITFEIHVNGQFVCLQRADGMIVSTPTGSTAYALSAGGPIVHPALDALLLAPICSHTLSSRPIVMNDDSVVELYISEKNVTDPHLAFDGMGRIAIPADGVVTVKKHEKKLRLIHPKHYDYYKMLREKLGWERHAKRG